MHENLYGKIIFICFTGNSWKLCAKEKLHEKIKITPENTYLFGESLVRVVLMSSSETSNCEIISASISSNVTGLREDVTMDLISKLAIDPVIVGIALGTREVGEMTGCPVGFAVIKTA